MDDVRNPSARAAPPDDESGRAQTRFPRATPIAAQLRRIIQLTGAMEGKLARTLDVNHTDLQVMQHLMQSGPLQPSELARRIGVTAAATTQSVDRLVAQGHASRRPHPEDGRRVVVQPAPASIGTAAAELMPLIGAVTELTSGLGADDARVVEDFLGRVVAIYEDVLGDDKETHPPR